jgi:hypothetical protein
MASSKHPRPESGGAGTDHPAVQARTHLDTSAADPRWDTAHFSPRETACRDCGSRITIGQDAEIAGDADGREYGHAPDCTHKYDGPPGGGA